MSKREATGSPVDLEIHNVLMNLITRPMVVIQQTNEEDYGGSQIWFELSGQAYKISLEKCNAPLKDISGKPKLFVEKDVAE